MAGRYLITTYENEMQNTKFIDYILSKKGNQGFIAFLLFVVCFQQAEIQIKDYDVQRCEQKKTEQQESFIEYLKKGNYDYANIKSGYDSLLIEVKNLKK